MAHDKSRSDEVLRQRASGVGDAVEQEPGGVLAKAAIGVSDRGQGRVGVLYE